VLVILLGVLVVMAVMAALTLLRPGPAGADAWAERHGLRLTPDDVAMVSWYLQTASRLRTVGVVAGLVLPPLAVWSLGLSARVTFPYWTWVFLGYLAGAIYAEVSLVRRGDPARPVAALHPRALGEYLHPRLLGAQRVAGGVALVVAAAIAVVPNRVPATQALGRLPAVALTLVAALLALGLEVVERWLVTRPQPFDAPDLVATDDAIRSTSVHAVAGSGLAVVLLGIGTGCMWLAGSDVPVLRWTMWAPGVLAWLVALWSCARSAHRPWRVVRGEVVSA
jgi:hypothetical protein